MPLKINFKYVKFKDFSQARNESLDMNTCQYILWIDDDDFVQTPIGMRDVIFRNPDMDIFRCEIWSQAEGGGWEKIYHPRLVRNILNLRFRNSVHEDLMLCAKELKLKTTTTNMNIKHLGYTGPKVVIEKNKRNIGYLLKEIKDGVAHSLTYYHLINSYMVIAYHTGDKELFKKAMKLIDEVFKKFELKADDPITPKLWILRGHCCERFNQLAAKQAYHKAWDEWKHPEGGVNLAEMYKREGKFDKAIEILEELYNMKEIRVGSNLAFNMNEIKHILLKKLGDCYMHKFNSRVISMPLGKKDTQEQLSKDHRSEWLKKAEQHYRQCLMVVDDLEVIDRLCQILRNTKRLKEANVLTVEAVNRFPSYAVGWKNLAASEMLANRYATSKVFLEEALKRNPLDKESKHNLEMLKKGKYNV